MRRLKHVRPQTHGNIEIAYPRRRVTKSNRCSVETVDSTLHLINFVDFNTLVNSRNFTYFTSRRFVHA